METAIEVKHLFKFKLSIKTLQDVNLTFSYGKTIGIIGDAQSGKTLLMKTIAGMDKQYEGSIYVDNQKWSHASKAIIAYLGDTFMFESHYKIDQLADIYADLFDDFNALAFDEYLRDLSIGRNARVNTLSLANKKKLQLSFILSRDSPIYLFCEPKDGYDTYTENALKTFINDHRNPE
ncbi:MAG: ATP-binding cassette domain-containing protein, partial [Bacillota bacterium]